MKNAQLIHEYLDGEIDSGKEELLFARLNSDSELRKELNTQMKIVSLAQRDKAMTIPPPALTNSLFNKLGYELPMNGAALKPEPGFFRKNLLWLLLLLLSVSTLSTVYYASRNSTLNNELAKIGKVQNSKSIPVTSSVEGNKYKSNLTDLAKSDGSSNVNDNNNSLFSNSGKNGYNATSENKNVDNRKFNLKDKKSGKDKSGNILTGKDSDTMLASLNGKSIDQNLIIRFSDISKMSTQKQIGNLNKHNVFNSFGSGMPINNGFVADLSNYQLYIIDKSKWNIQIKRFNSYSSSPEVSVGSKADFYENIAISFWYQVNSFHSFGIEAGNESFSQEFTTKSNLVYHQKPELFWIGASYRFSAKEWLVPYILYPYLQGGAGVTTIGPIFKAQTGLVFNLYGPISVVGGVEYGVLFYNVDSKLYNSNKINVFGGVSINF